MAIKLVVRNKAQNTITDDQTLVFNEMLVTIGSNQTASVFLKDSKVAPEQAVIINEEEDQLLINQAKGTILNNQVIDEGVRYKLKSGDEISIGAYSLTVFLDKQVEEHASLAQENPDSMASSSPEPEPDNRLDTRSFADILTSLRKEEDQFYFQVTDGDGAKRRLPITDDEIALGWNQTTNIFISGKKSTIERPQAIIRKDWSGVTVYPQGSEPILLNEALLEASNRLKNGDKLVFSRRLNDRNQTATLIFCEPAALVELNTILPQELLSNAFETVQSGEIKSEQETVKENKQSDKKLEKINVARKEPKKKNNHYFGYFTTIEIVIMIIGTIITAILTFVLLEFLS